MQRKKGPCFIANAASATSNLGYVLSRVCVLHDQSPSTGLIGSAMTKAISIETALLVSSPAGWPAAPLGCAFVFFCFWWSKLIALNRIKAPDNNFALIWKKHKLASTEDLPTLWLHKNCRTINTVLIGRHSREVQATSSYLSRGGKKGQTDVITASLVVCLKSATVCPVRWRRQQAVHLSNHWGGRSSHQAVKRWTLLPSGEHEMRHWRQTSASTD